MKTNIYKTLLLLVLISGSAIVHAQWTKVSTTGASDLVVKGSTLFACNGSGVSKTTNGSTWEATGSVSGGGALNCLVLVDNALYLGANGSTLFKSTDDGATWTMITGRSGLTSVKTTCIYTDGNNITYGTSGSGKWQYTTDGGSSWSGSDVTWGATIGDINPDIVKIGSTLFSSGYNTVFKSTDNGANWDTTRNIGAVNSLCVQGSTLYSAGYGSGVMKSTDNGATWTCKLGCSIMDLTRTATRIISSGSNIFVGGALGKVNQSSDGGATWTDLSGDGTVLSGFDIITSLAVFNNELYVSTGTGIYKRNFTGGSTGIEESILPEVAVFPNPAAEVLHIETNTIILEVTICDITGRNVAMSTSFNNGTMELNTASLQPGIYTITIQTKVGTSNQKFTKL